MEYEELLNIPYKRWYILLFIVTIMLILSVALLFVPIYDVYNTYGYFQDGNLVLNIPTSYSDTILNGQYYKIGDDKYEIEILYIGDMMVDSSYMFNYQEIILTSSLDYPQNLVVEVSIYYNKERLLKKVANFL